MIELEQSEKNTITTLWLNRPDKGNALNHRLIKEMTQVLLEIQNTPSRLLIIRARGSHFCTGADLDDMHASGKKSDADNLVEAEQLSQLFYQLEQLPTPVIAVAQGCVFGGGIGLLCCADICIGVTGSKAPLRLCFSEVKLGLVPAVISPYVIRAMGKRQARRYLLSAEVLDEISAYHTGLVHLLSNYSEVEQRLASLTNNILANGPNALSACKQLLRDSEYPQELSLRNNNLCKLIAEIRASDEGLEGVTAFLQKRPPAWNQHQPPKKN